MKTTTGDKMNKYAIIPLRLQRQRTLITLTNDYPLPRINIIKKQGRIIDTGHNFVVHFADGSAAIPCRKLKDALCYVTITGINNMPSTYTKSLK